MQVYKGEKYANTRSKWKTLFCCPDVSSSFMSLIELATHMVQLVMPPFEKGGAYCFANVGLYVGIP